MLLQLTKLTYKHARRIVVTVIGVTIVLMGVALIVLPGPGILVILFGLAVLATEFVWARRLLKRIKQTVGLDRTPRAGAADVTNSPDPAAPRSALPSLAASPSHVTTLPHTTSHSTSTESQPVSDASPPPDPHRQE